MTKANYIVIFFLGLLSCNMDDEPGTVILQDSLATLVSNNTVEIDNVISCASGVVDQENTIIAYFYPRPGSSDFRYYETSTIEDDKNDYQNYRRVAIEPSDLFNGYLKKFTRTIPEEKWVIITFFEEEKLHLSNPIHLKHITKPTEYTDTVFIDESMPENPIFSWQDGTLMDSAIYFQVISDVTNNLLSGTYTTEKTFQYYNISNVVLNITRETPPQLIPANSYDFTLMGVSEDNWVNLLIQKNFTP